MNRVTIFFKDLVLTGLGILFKVIYDENKIVKKIPIRPKNILCLTIAAIGDTVMTSHCYELIKKKFPHTRISVLIAAHLGTKPIIEHNPYIDEVVEYHKNFNPLKNGAFFKNLRNTYDTVLAFYPSQFIGAYICHKIQPQQSVGHRYRLGFFQQDAPFGYSIPLPLVHQHQVELNSDVVKKLEVSIPKHPVPKIYLSAEQVAYGKRFIRENHLKGKKIVGIHAGSGTSQLKRWPREYFVELIRKLQCAYSATVILFGGKEEYALNDWIAHQVTQNIIVAKTSLPESLAIMHECSFFVGNDGGPAHCASALGKLTFTVFGVTDPKLVMPYEKMSQVITQKHPSMPCYDIYHGVCCSKKIVDEYWRSITPDTVFKRIERTLKNH